MAPTMKPGSAQENNGPAQKGNVTLPDVYLSDSNGQSVVSELAQYFSDAGCLLLRDVFSTSYLTSLKGELPLRNKYLTNLSALNVGDRRVMQTIGVKGQWNSPELYANEHLMMLMRLLLGEDLILGSLVLVNSFPGAGAQHIHRDHDLLYPEGRDADHTPPFAVTVMIPLIEQNKTSGNTRVWPGSHRDRTCTAESLPEGVDYVANVGDCLLMDYRLMHQGLANKGDVDRPVISMIYYKRWFRDTVNYRKQRALAISMLEKNRVPNQHRNLFSGLRLDHPPAQMARSLWNLIRIRK